MPGHGEKFFIFTSIQWWSSGSRRQPSDIVSQLSGRGGLVFTFYISLLVDKWQPSGGQYDVCASSFCQNLFQIYVRTQICTGDPGSLACMIHQRQYCMILLLPRDHEKTNRRSLGLKAIFVVPHDPGLPPLTITFSISMCDTYDHIVVQMLQF